MTDTAFSKSSISCTRCGICTFYPFLNIILYKELKVSTTKFEGSLSSSEDNYYLHFSVHRNMWKIYVVFICCVKLNDKSNGSPDFAV